MADDTSLFINGEYLRRTKREAASEQESASGYQPAPPRPFKSRGGTGKHAAYKHGWYLENRQRILLGRHAKSAKSPKKQRTPEWKARSHKRRSIAAKRHWKKMSATARQKALGILAVGRSLKQAQYSDRRRHWEAVRARLEGASFNTIVAQIGPSLKSVNYCFRSTDLPKGKRYIFHRGHPFTRGDGTQLRESLGLACHEFAQRVGVRERRPMIWLTKPQNHLWPPEALRCMIFRRAVADRLLAGSTRSALRGYDAYDRRAVLMALFPSLRMEYKLLLETIPDLRRFLLDHPSCSEEEIAKFALQQAQRETNGELQSRGFRFLLWWLPELMPLIVPIQGRFAGDENARFLVYELLAGTCGTSPKIIKSALSDTVRPAKPRRMRELLRIYFPSDGAADKDQKQTHRPLGPDTKEKIRRATAFFLCGWTQKPASQYVCWDKHHTDSAFLDMRQLVGRHGKKIDELKKTMSRWEAILIAQDAAGTHVPRR